MKKKLQNEELDDRAKRRNTNYCNRKIVLINVMVGGNLNSVLSPISFIHTYPSIMHSI